MLGPSTVTSGNPAEEIRIGSVGGGDETSQTLASNSSQSLPSPTEIGKEKKKKTNSLCREMGDQSRSLFSRSLVSTIVLFFFFFFHV